MLLRLLFKVLNLLKMCFTHEEICIKYMQTCCIVGNSSLAPDYVLCVLHTDSAMLHTLRF